MLPPLPVQAIAFSLLLVLFPAARLPATPGSRPNILYFYVDDMGWGSIGPNGQAARRQAGKPSVQTPHLDRLAAEGINFTRGYGCHVCSPARSSQQSGFHQGHTFADRNDPNNAKKAMRAADVLMGDKLSSAGYVTGYWGKWGYGGSKDLADPIIQNVQTLPTSHGYQHVLAELHHVRAHTFFQPTLWHAPAPSATTGGLRLVPNSMAAYQNKPNFPDIPALQNHPDYPRTGYCDDAYAFAALEFVRQQSANYKQTGQPFFGLLAVQIPHAPFAEISQLPDWDRAYRDKKWFSTLPDQAQHWAAMVTRIDAHFGNILAALEEQGVADDTLVIFQSDNGGPAGKSDVVFEANGGLRGHKGSIQEGGIRVPLVMRWPAKIDANSKLQAGSHSDRVVDVTDLLPTFCELAGTTPPLSIDGVSLAATLLGSGQQRHRDFIIHEAGNGQSIIRGKYKLVRNQKSSLALYDLSADLAEQSNIASQHPKLVQELETLLLGERVDEPRGFANTYHDWTGGDDGVTSDADNWSDYIYANAGIVYSTDRGAPQSSWTAKIHNKGERPATARGDADLEFLGLEIGGRTATQSLRLGPDVNLTGRNEIRIAEHGALVVDGGNVASLRWIDVDPGGTLRGQGTLDADLYNRGTVELILADGEESALNVKGTARLAGTLAVSLNAPFHLAPGATLPVLKARRRVGRFQNPGHEVVTENGTRFSIGYTKNTVTLTRME